MLINKAKKDGRSGRSIPKTITKNCIECGCTFIGTAKAKVCSKSCGQRIQYTKNMLNPEWRLGKLLSMAKNRSIEKGLDFNLDLVYLKELWDILNGCCILTGIPFVLERAEFGKVHPYAPSIDRIVPSLGYTKGNIRLIVYQFNVAMSEYGQEQFDDMVSKYQAYQKQI